MRHSCCISQPQGHVALYVRVRTLPSCTTVPNPCMIPKACATLLCGHTVPRGCTLGQCISEGQQFLGWTPVPCLHSTHLSVCSPPQQHRPPADMHATTATALHWQWDGPPGMHAPACKPHIARIALLHHHQDCNHQEITGAARQLLLLPVPPPSVQHQQAMGSSYVAVLQATLVLHIEQDSVQHQAL